MPPKKNTKSKQIQPENPVDQIIQNVVQDFVNEAPSTSQEISTPKKRTRKPRATKKKDPSSQEESNIIDPSTSPAKKAETQPQEEITPTKKRPGRKPKVKREVVTVKEEPQEQQQPTTTVPQHQLLFINATPEEPVKKKPGRKPKAKKQEEDQQHSLSEEKIRNVQSTSAIPTLSSSPAAIRNLINLDDDSIHPYGFNKGQINLSEPQGNSNYNSPVAPSSVVQPVIAPITNPTSTSTPPSAPAPSKRGRPKKVKVDSQTAATVDISETHDAKPTPTKKRKSRKQEVSVEPDKQSEIIVGENFTPQEQVGLNQQQAEGEIEQSMIPAKTANPVKKRRSRKRDAITPQTTAIETTIEQTQNEQQPIIKTTKRGRPKKKKPVDKPAVDEETYTINTTNMEEVDDTKSIPVIEPHIIGPQQPQQKSSIDVDSQSPSMPSEQENSTGPIKPNVDSINSDALNEDIKISEHKDQEKPSDFITSQTVDGNSKVKLTKNFDDNNTSVVQQVDQDVTMEDAQNKTEVKSLVGEQSVKRKRSSDNDDSYDEDSEQPTPKKLSRIEEFKAKRDKFNKLRSRMDEGESANRKEVYEEHQRKKTNPRELVRQERKREEAEKLLAKQQAEERGEDYERSKYWEYSIESVEKWEKKQEKKAKKSDVAFTDYNQVATKKYKRQINELKPDLVTYNEQKAAAIASSSLIKAEDGQIVPVDTESNFYRDANSLQYASVDNQPSREAIDRVVADVNKTIARREKSSRQKTINEEDDITYINERNRRFNEKIGRFYDKYTKEIKENFERGTAL